VRHKDGKYLSPTAGPAADCLVAFTDNERTIEQAEVFGVDSVVEYRSRHEVMDLAWREGFSTVAVRRAHRPEDYTSLTLRKGRRRAGVLWGLGLRYARTSLGAFSDVRQVSSPTALRGMAERMFYEYGGGHGST
jgi:hypothetical protein